MMYESEHTTAEEGKNPILEGVIWKQLLIFFFPILFGTMFQQLYNTADALIVGRFIGKEALAAVAGSAGQIINLIVGFFVGLASGASVLVSQYYGAEEDEKVSRAVHTILVFSVICGVMLTAAGIIGTPAFLRRMNTPEETMGQSVLYLRVYFAGMVGNLIYNVGSGILRAAGDSRRPLYFLIACCLMNIVLDIIFVIPMRMGIFGAALATILSQAFSALLVLIVMQQTRDSYRLVWSRMTMDLRMLGKMIRIGLPAGMQSVMYGISNIIIQMGINGLGTDTTAAWAAYYKIDGVFWMTVSAFGISITTFVGQNYGAGKTKRVYSSIVSCLLMAAGSSVTISAVVYGICPWLLKLFVTDAAVQAIGVDMMRFLTPFYILYVGIEILSGALRGVGDTLIPMLISVLGICLLRSAWIVLLLPGHNNMYTLMWSYPVSWAVTTLTFAVYTLVFSRLKPRGRGPAQGGTL